MECCRDNAVKLEEPDSRAHLVVANHALEVVASGMRWVVDKHVIRGFANTTEGGDLVFWLDTDCDPFFIFEFAVLREDPLLLIRESASIIGIILVARRVCISGEAIGGSRVDGVGDTGSREHASFSSLDVGGYDGTRVCADSVGSMLATVGLLLYTRGPSEIFHTVVYPATIDVIHGHSSRGRSVERLADDTSTTYEVGNTARRKLDANVAVRRGDGSQSDFGARMDGRNEAGGVEAVQREASDRSEGRRQERTNKLCVRVILTLRICSGFLP